MRVPDKADIGDGICAYLTGGLGNQLFVYAAAYAQARRLGCPLYIDASALGDGNLRAFELGTLPLKGRVLSDDSPWRGRSPTRYRRWQRDSALAVYRERGFGFEPEIGDVAKGTTLVGYFQSWRYFAEFHSEIREWFSAAIADLAWEERPADIHVHVRRGDYLQPGTSAFHGVASPGYFSRALALQRRIGAFDVARVFSDSPELARTELGEEPGLVFEESRPGASSLESLLVMSRARRFILSNSSFSWWAAWLSEATEFVIAPRPWLASGESAADLLLPDWVTLDAR